MGHMLNNSLQDILIRRARMKASTHVGFQVQRTCFIATEAKVVAKLKRKGLESPI